MTSEAICSDLLGILEIVKNYLEIDLNVATTIMKCVIAPNKEPRHAFSRMFDIGSRSRDFFGDDKRK